jgi:hypothetical protein
MSVLGQLGIGNRVLGASRVSTGAAPTVLNFSDSGTGADAVISRFATEAKTDTGSAADALARNVTETKGDAGSATDALSRAIHSTKADSGAATDALSRTATEQKSDAGAATDALARSATEQKADSGTATDARTTAVTRSRADAGSGADVLALQEAETINLGDSGTGSDSLSLVPRTSLSFSDAGSAADAIELVQSTIPLDIGTPWLQTGAPTTARRRKGLRALVRARTRVRAKENQTFTVHLSFADQGVATDLPTLEWRRALFVSDIVQSSADLQNEVVGLLMAGVI